MKLVPLFLGILFLIGGDKKPKFIDHTLTITLSYSSTKEFTNTFGRSFFTKAYLIDDSQVYEYYSQDDQSFLGLYMEDGSIPFEKVEYFKTKKNNGVFSTNTKSIPQHNFDNGLHNGMTEYEVETVLGVPSSFKYSILGDKQLLTYFYEDETILYFVDGKLDINYLQN